MLASRSTAVILVNYRNPADTLDCLASLHRLTEPPGYIMVVDNGSSPHSLESLRTGWTAICSGHGLDPPVVVSHEDVPGPRAILPLTDNAGFSGGNNAALRLLLATDCEGFWLLNNDATAEPKALQSLCDYGNAHPRAGLVGSTIVYRDRPDIVQCAGGGTLCRLTGRTDFVLGGMAHGNLQRVDKKATADTLDWVSGCSCLIRRKTLETVGLLPEEYFLYYEDVAYSLAVKTAGFGLGWARDSLVEHREGGSSGSKGGGDSPVSRSAYVDYLTIRNRFYLLRTCYPWSLPVALASLSGVWLNRVKRGQAGRIPLLLRAAIRGIRGRMGPAVN